MKNKKVVNVDSRILNFVNAKRIFSIILLFVGIILTMSMVSAVTYYVDSTNGVDTNNGLSVGNAIKTISKVNTLSLNPGDSVLFKKGETWYVPTDDWLDIKNGNSNGNITYSSYGTGNKPVLAGSIHANKINNWIKTDTNVWRYNGTITRDIGNVIFNFEGSVGIKESSQIKSSTQGHYFYDKTNDLFYLHSVSNPATYYTDIQLAYNYPILMVVGSTWKGNSYVKISNLSLKYGAEHGVYIGYGSHHIYVENNDISWMGGGEWSSGRWGNGIEIWETANNIYIYNNKLWEIWDAALTTQGDVSNTAFNHYFYNNIVYNSSYCFEIFENSAGSKTTSVSFIHNTCHNIGEMWGKNVRYDSSQPKCYRIGNMYGVVSKINISNNICDVDNSFYYTSMTVFNNWQSNNNLFLDYNLYNISGRTKIFWDLNNGHIYSNLAAFILGEGKEQHSKEGVVMLNTKTWQPSTSSPACKMSSTGSYVGALPCAGSTIVNSAPTQGTPILKSSNYPNNTSSGNLNCYNTSTKDADGDSVTNKYKWYKNSVLISTLTKSTVSFGNLSAGQIWVCEITPYDGKINGVALNSSKLTIQAVQPSTVLGLQGSWDLSTDYVDKIKGNKALNYGATGFVTDSTYGSVLKLKNSSSYLKINYANNSLTPKEGFTVDVKVKFDSTKQSHIVRDKESYLLQKVYVNKTTARFQAGIYKNNAWIAVLDSNTNLQMNKWYRITYTYDKKSNLYKLYIDKKLNVQKTWAGTVDTSSSSQIFVGNREQLDRWLDGSMHDLRIYDRALSDTEVSNMV